MQEQSRRVWVFFEDDYHLCRILKYEKCAYDVELPDGNILNTTNVQRANPPKFDLVDDLASLSHLNEPAVLYVLKNRYHQNMIYTHSGLFLVAVNPYKNLDIYSSNFIKMYSQNDTSLPPHIYKTVNEAYTNMILNKNNQSILITGESGAGKTENTKKAISFLLTLSENDKVNDKNNSNLVEQIIKANVILESFGNAMTIRNDNSSRFGKFIQLNFKSGNIVGCTIEKYLLEKSRVVKSNGNERNYHIFYQLLRSNRKDLLDKLGLSSDIKKYKILNNFTDLNDTLMFDLLIDAFDTLNFAKEEIFEFFKFVAVILHLGNIEFYEEENVKIKNMDTLNLVCNLLNIPISKFVKYILHPNKSAGKEKITVIHSINQCKIILEGVIKILYDYLFDKIIESINKKLNSNTSHDNYIGILDIAGFEIFPFNSLEQLSINYTNEKLQQFFNHHMFILEQEIYKREEIDWNYIDFGLDLKPTIDTIEKVFNILEDQCSLINSNDKSFLISLQNDFNNLNDKLSFNKIKDSCFNLIHYAGKVEYNTNDWLVKNYDPYFTDIINLLSLHKTDNLTSKGFFRTVSQLYKNQLELLMNKLRKTNPFFVRCIIPNNNKKRGVIDSMLVLKQLKSNGILEGIRISRLGYPNRMNYEEFVKRYKIIIFNEEKNINFNKEKRINEENNGKNNLSYFNKNINNTFENNSLIYAVKITKEILNRLNISKEFYKLGKSMIFFKQDILAYIEESRENKVSLVFNKVIQYVNSITHTLKQNKICSRMKSIKILQHNALLSNAFRRWQWWYFYLKIKPLLKVYQMDDIIKGKEKEISYLTDSLKEKENYLKSLQDENNEIKNKLISKEKMNESINLLIYEKENELEKLKNSLKKIKEEENEKNNQINLLLEKEEELEKLKNTLKKVKEEEKEKNEILEEKENLLNEHKRKIIELQTELETNENLSKNKTEEIIKIKDKEITKMKYEIELLKEKEEKLIEEKKEKENLKNELKSLKNENKLLKNDLNKVNQKEKELTNNLQEESFKLMDLESKFSLLKMDNELLVKEIEKNNSKITELEEKMSNYELLEEENFNLKENINLQKKTIDSLKERNLGLEEKIKKIESSNISELNIKINELNKKLIKEKRNLKHLEKENSFLAQENKRLNSDKIKELEEIREGYEKKIKELDLKLLSYNFNLKEESESTEDNRVILLLEEEKLRSNELERLLTEQENKNVELQSKLKNREYELIDKINNLERKYNSNKEKFNLLITGLTEYYNKTTLNNQPCNCNKKFNLIINKQEKEKEYLNNQLTNLKNELKTNQEDLLINFKELNNLEIKLKEKELILKLKEKELKNINLRLEKELKEKNDLICKFNDYVDCSDKLNELEVVNLQLKRQVDELIKVVEFYKPFSGLKK